MEIKHFVWIFILALRLLSLFSHFFKCASVHGALMSNASPVIKS